MGGGLSHISSLSQIQSFQLNFYFTEEIQVIKITLKKYIRVQHVFLTIQLLGSPCLNVLDAISDIAAVILEEL